MAVVPLALEEDYAPPNALDQTLIKDVACSWVPQMSPPWDVEYDAQGLAGMTQQWLAFRDDRIPIVLRQLLSWNRKRFGGYASFKDAFATDATLYQQGLVVVGANLQPMEANNSPGAISGHMQSPNFKGMFDHICISNQPNTPCPAGRFPSIVSDKYLISLRWARDEYVNRFGINYAKVEIAPSIRLESIHGSSLGVLPMNADGTPKVTATPAEIRRLTIGFPQREPQVNIRIAYPWVAMGAAGGQDVTSLLHAGPFGRGSAATLAPGKVPQGQYLGTVNTDSFLGYPRGHVLYQSAALEQRVSPATGRLGFMVTHEFLALSNSSWNTTRSEGEPSASLANEPDAETPQWPLGYIVAIKRDNSLLLIAGKPVYPYVHKDFAKLLYYGWDGGGNPIPTDEG